MGFDQEAAAVMMSRIAVFRLVLFSPSELYTKTNNTVICCPAIAMSIVFPINFFYKDIGIPWYMYVAALKSSFWFVCMLGLKGMMVQMCCGG